MWLRADFSWRASLSLSKIKFVSAERYHPLSNLYYLHIIRCRRSFLVNLKNRPITFAISMPPFCGDLQGRINRFLRRFRLYLPFSQHGLPWSLASPLLDLLSQLVQPVVVSTQLLDLLYRPDNSECYWYPAKEGLSDSSPWSKTTDSTARDCNARLTLLCLDDRGEGGRWTNVRASSIRSNFLNRALEKPRTCF